MYGLLVEEVSTQETAAYRQKYKQVMFSPVLVHYVPDTETGGSILEQVLEFYTILNAVDEAEAGKDSGGKGNPYIAASLQFSLIVFDYS